VDRRGLKKIASCVVPTPVDDYDSPMAIINNNERTRRTNMMTRYIHAVVK